MLSILVLLIAFFIGITSLFFLYAVFLRIRNGILAKQNIRLKANWDKAILNVMHNEAHPYDVHKSLKRKNSIRYLFYLEEFIDLLKGKEKERLLMLGRLSLKNVYRYLRSSNDEKHIYGIHLIGIFHPEEQFEFLKINTKDMNMTLTAIREIHPVDDIGITEQTIKMLFNLPSVSYIYISNLLLEMGSDIIPFLQQVIENRFEAPHEQMIAIETIRRMHHMGALNLSEKILTQSTDPGVLSCWLRYLEDQRDENQLELVNIYIDHPNPQVRTAATRTYIILSDGLTAQDVTKIFNDDDIMVPINASEVIDPYASIPYLSTDAIENLKWKDIYKEILI